MLLLATAWPFFDPKVWHPNHILQFLSVISMDRVFQTSRRLSFHTEISEALCAEQFVVEEI